MRNMNTNDSAEMCDEDVVAELRIRIRRDGAMSVAGCINEKDLALAMCDQARECITNNADRQKLQSQSGLIIPHYDSALRAH